MFGQTQGNVLALFTKFAVADLLIVVVVVVIVGPKPFARSHCDDPLSAFLLFIQPIEKIVVDMTNLYGRRTLGENWSPVDITTMRAFYGLLILAGVYRSKYERNRYQ